jgi:Protein of unknown function (DUF973)
MTWGPPRPQVPDMREADLKALSHIRIAALISIIGSIIGVAIPILLTSTGYIRAVIPSSGAPLGYTTSTLTLVLGLGVVGIAISVVSFWYYRDGFLALRGIDTRFSSSPTWALLVVIGLILVALAIVVLLAILLPILSCTGSTTMIPASCLNLGGLLGAVGLIFLAVIILLIGYIGTLVAIWRLGDRFGNSLFKIGAVLLIIPYVAFVGQILILVAASGAQTQLRQRPGFAMGMAPSIPSPPGPPSY